MKTDNNLSTFEYFIIIILFLSMLLFGGRAVAQDFDFRLVEINTIVCDSAKMQTDTIIVNSQLATANQAVQHYTKLVEKFPTRENKKRLAFWKKRQSILIEHRISL